MYQALYRKYRPQTFDDVVGQGAVTQTLKNQLQTGKLSHAYLFTGTRGTGKTSCSKILAKAVNCLDLQDGNPCNRCRACRAIDSGACLDVLEIDAASNNGVDQVRALRDDAVYTPSEVRKRVYIVDEVHMLSMAAFNALLKIIEEPPEHLMFILATTELHKVPATILSRCQRFSFRRLLQEDIAGRLNYIAYQAMNGKKGAVGVYNYETGEILCMVSTPTFDPANPPTIEDGDPEYEGVYLNRFLSGTFTPGSVFKTITLTAAIENIPDLFSRSFTCTGSTTVGGEEITCPFAHGEMDINSALANSCNGVFAQLATELGAETMSKYVEKAGILDSYSVDGIATAKGSFDLTGASTSQIGWSGVGQYNDLVNPCAMMVWMGAIANQGKTAVPYLISKTEGDLPLPSLPHFTKKTDQLIDADTAQVVGDMMANNVRETYGSSRFPNMDICAKSGTAEVGGGKKPNAWFAGFLRNSDAPYAFVVVLEEGGSGANAAGNVAAQVLDALVNGY